MHKTKKQFIEQRFGARIKELEAKGLRNHIRVLEGSNSAQTQIGGQRILNFNSNNFLGFANDPRVIAGAQQALAQYGVGPGAVRSISGTLSIHRMLEQELARFKGAEDCVVVQSGFVANTALLPTLLGPDDCVISDALNHASIIDGIRLSKTNKMIYEHSNMDDLETNVKEAKTRFPNGMILIVTDGVFSMDGEIANLPAIVAIAQKHGAFTYVDDAWGEFSLGLTGRGTPEHFGLQHIVDFEVGTLSKGFGVQGGFITGPRTLIDFIRQRSRPFIFSTGLGIAECGAGLAVLAELNRSTTRIKTLHKRAQYFADGLQKMGFDVPSQTQIIPLMIRDEKTAQKMANLLFENGVFVTPIVFPTVPKGTARCRFIVSANHTIDDLNRCLEIIQKCARQLNLLA